MYLYYIVGQPLEEFLVVVAQIRALVVESAARLIVAEQLYKFANMKQGL